MVSFTCQCCQDVIKKPKVVGHASGCGGPHATFSCVDCMQVFDLESIKHHTSCVTEVEKYQGQWLQKKKCVAGTAPPVRPPRPAMNDLSDSDDDWVHTAKKPKKESPQRSSAPRTSLAPTPPAPAPSSAVECLVPSFSLGSSAEVADIVAGILRDQGVSQLSTKKAAQELVQCYHKRIAKHVRTALEDTLQHNSGLPVRKRSNGDVELTS